MRRIGVIIPAGGAGRRMGGVRKPYLELSGEPILARSLRPFLERDDVFSVIVALPPDTYADPPEWLTADGRVGIVAGGSERSDSVRNALAALPLECDIVLVHDAARPLVTPVIVQRCIDAAADGRSAIAAIPASPDRRRLWAAQTPQAFPASVLRDAHARALVEGVASTDDAALVARYGGTVVVVEGAAENLKVTTPADIAVAAALLERTNA
jgi:2-C-methyl-D-erythritol 4-phosphate cytidylyltransferase